MFDRKGQGAMEYLMTYGWAILVVMIVGIAMWQLGIFNMGGTTVTSTGFAKIKPQLAGTGLTADGQFIGVFTNGVGTRIDITAVRIYDQNNAGAVLCCSHVAADGGVDCNNAGFDIGPGHVDFSAFPGSVSLGAGNNINIILGDTSNAALDCLTGGAAGEVFDIRVQIDYTVDIGGVSSDHTETGTFRGPLE